MASLLILMLCWSHARVKETANSKALGQEELNGPNPDIVAALITAPAVIQMLGDIAGKRVVEFGRGGDCWQRLLQRLGATCVSDDMPEQTKIPEVQVRRSKIRFATKRDTQVVSERAADIVFMNYVLSGLSSLEDLDAAIGRARALIDGAEKRLIINDRHPFTSYLPGMSQDQPDRYLKPGANLDRVIMQSPEDGLYQIHPAGFHWPLQTVHELLVKHDFRLSGVQEPVPHAAIAKSFLGAGVSEYFTRFPATLVIAAAPVQVVSSVP
ncbi:MAG TPA: hypothetical protein VGM08_01020 [Candidatus Saccharimonadales bacterium]|jgi:hypothetical protein